MAKPYGISGTPWHVELFRNNNPKDSRRHRSRCMFYVPESKACKKHSDVCYGASHCPYYKEKTADTVTDNAFNDDEEMRSKPGCDLDVGKYPDNKLIKKSPPVKRLATKVRVGTVISFGTVEYFVWNIRQDEDLNFRYECRKIIELAKPDEERKKLWLYGNYYLDLNNTELDYSRVRSVKELDHAIVKRILAEKNRKDAVQGIRESGRKEPSAGSKGPVHYTIVPTESGGRPANTAVKPVFLVVRNGHMKKQLQAFLDQRTQKVYLERTLYEKYKAVLFNEAGAEIKAR